MAGWVVWGRKLCVCEESEGKGALESRFKDIAWATNAKKIHSDIIATIQRAGDVGNDLFFSGLDVRHKTDGHMTKICQILV
jgi:hypothetical protein